MIKKTAAAALAVLIALSVLGLTGCAQWFHNPVDDANAAIATANNHLKAHAASDAAAKKLVVDLNAFVAKSPADAAKALLLTEQLRAEYAKQKTELEAAKKAILSIKTMEVKDEFKKYADLEAKQIDTRIAIAKESTSLYATMDKIYIAIRDKNATNAATQKTSTELDTIMNNVAALTEQAKGESEAAAAYFEEQKLGGN